MRSALYGDRIYSLGAIVARRLSKNKAKGVIFGGIFATRLAAHFNLPIRHKEDHELPPSLLDFNSMKRHAFISKDATFNDYKYNLVFNQDTHDIITLPASTLFDRQGKGRYFIMPNDIIDYRRELEEANLKEISPWEEQVYQPGPFDFQYSPGPSEYQPVGLSQARPKA